MGGGRNPFLGYAYLVVGSISLLSGTILAIVYCLKKSSLEDEQDEEFEYEYWNKKTNK